MTVKRSVDISKLHFIRKRIGCAFRYCSMCSSSCECHVSPVSDTDIGCHSMLAIEACKMSSLLLPRHFSTNLEMAILVFLYPVLLATVPATTRYSFFVFLMTCPKEKLNWSLYQRFRVCLIGNNSGNGRLGRLSCVSLTLRV